MNKQSLSPEESLELITKVIREAKNKFEENGFIYVMWGILIAFASIGQFLLLKGGYYTINYIPYFLMPLGGVYSWYYYSKKARGIGRNNQIAKIVSISWIIISINIMLLGFFLGTVLKQNLVPNILILLGIGTVISGASLKSKLVLISGIIINISGFACYSLEWINHSLVMGIVAIIAIFIPGLILMIKSKGK